MLGDKPTESHHPRVEWREGGERTREDEEWRGRGKKLRGRGEVEMRREKDGEKGGNIAATQV